MPRTKDSRLYMMCCFIQYLSLYVFTVLWMFSLMCGSDISRDMEFTVCLGVCLLGWVVGRSLCCLILFLYVNRFKWHIFEVPTRRSASGYIVTAHRCHCIHDCYWFSRAISHILATWKESTTIENLANLIKP